MSYKPIIGVVLDHETSNNFSKYPSYLLRENYFSSLISCGGIPFLLYHDIDLINSFVEKLNAIALDGVVEGIKHDLHKWCVGVQWHPEFLNTKYDKMIIKDFIEHCD